MLVRELDNVMNSELFRVAGHNEQLTLSGSAIHILIDLVAVLSSRF